MTVIEGNVIGESPTDRIGVGLADVVVAIHPHKAGARIDKLRGATVTTRTDERGNFRTQALLSPGDYLLVVSDPGTGEMLSFRPVEVLTGSTARIRVDALMVPLRSTSPNGSVAPTQRAASLASTVGGDPAPAATYSPRPGSGAAPQDSAAAQGSAPKPGAKGIDLRSRPDANSERDEKRPRELPPAPLLPTGIRGTAGEREEIDSAEPGVVPNSLRPSDDNTTPQSPSSP